MTKKLRASRSSPRPLQKFSSSIRTSLSIILTSDPLGRQISRETAMHDIDFLLPPRFPLPHRRPSFWRVFLKSRYYWSSESRFEKFFLVPLRACAAFRQPSVVWLIRKKGKNPIYVLFLWLCRFDEPIFPRIRGDRVGYWTPRDAHGRPCKGCSACSRPWLSRDAAFKSHRSTHYFLISQQHRDKFLFKPKRHAIVFPA